MTTYEEWRVTGTNARGELILGLWSEAEDEDAEAQARDYVAWGRAKEWTDGPHLHKRTVTEWTEVDA